MVFFLVICLPLLNIKQKMPKGLVPYIRILNMVVGINFSAGYLEFY